MLFFSSSVGDGFGGDYIYTKQISSTINSVENLSIIKIEHIKLAYIPIIFIFFPLLVLIPFMWRPMYRYKNIVTVLRNIRKGNDTLVIDHFRNAWVILLCFIFKAKKVVLVTHNIENQIAKECYLNKNIYVRIFYYFEYLKIKFWENLIFKYVSSITTITEEDAVNIKQYADKITVIKPFYDCRNINKNIILNDRMECLIVGSFNWKIKQENLMALLNEFHVSNRPKNFEIIIAGTMPDFFSKLITSSFEFVTLRLNYSSLDDLVNISRLAIAPDQIGGGFKLKILDYFYLGLPVFGLKGSMNGISSNARGVKSYGNYSLLVKGVLKQITEQDYLSDMSINNQRILRDCFSEGIMEQQVKNLLNRTNEI